MNNEVSQTVETLRRLLREAGEYGRDLMRLFAAELHEKSRSLMTMGAMAGAAALFLVVGFFCLTGALVGVIAYGLDSWRWALLIVGVGYGLMGMGLLLPLAGGLRNGLLRFDHTRNHLRNDAVWIKRQLAADSAPAAEAREPEPARRAA